MVWWGTEDIQGIRNGQLKKNLLFRGKHTHHVGVSSELKAGVHVFWNVLQG
jgi:hypothetical protein